MYSSRQDQEFGLLKVTHLFTNKYKSTMYVYMNAYIIPVLYFEHKTIDIYSKYDLKDCYFKRVLSEG